ncbi:MAG: hypothetical protein Q7R50_08695, partial [Dehalococcoidales bacterium]|nr:hypothetical protein [Dehalococcoidales bacterium]
FYPFEADAGQFLASTYRRGQDLTVFNLSFESGSKLTYYYLQDMAIKAPPLYTTLKNTQGLWTEVDGLAGNFTDWKSTASTLYPNFGGNAIFLDSELEKLPYYHLLNVSPTDPGWMALREQLSRGGRVYDNGDIQIYVPP